MPSNRIRIIDSVVDALEAIQVGQAIPNGGGTYETTMRVVRQLAPVFSDIERNRGVGMLDRQPLACVIPGTSRYTYEQGFEAMSVILPITIYVHVTTPTADDASRRSLLDAAIDDIIAAVSVDVTRASYAVWTKILEDETDEAEPERGNLMSGRILIECKYDRTTAKS